MLASLIPLLSSVISGAASGFAHRDTIDTINEERRKAQVPDAVLRASNILQEQAGQGLSNYEQQRADIQSQIPTSLNQIKDFVSGGGMVDAISSLYSKQNQSLRTLDTQNEDARKQNLNTYANFLGGTQGSYEQKAQDTQRMLALLAAGEKQAMTQDKLNYANQGAGGLDPTGDLFKMLSSTDVSGFLAALLAKKGNNEIPNFNASVPNIADFYDSGL